MKELADAAASAPGRRCVCTHQMAALFSVMAAILKVWCQMENATLSINAHLNWSRILPNFISIQFEMTEP